MQINRRFDDYPRLRACFHGRAQNFEVNFIERRLSATAVFRFETFSVARKPEHLFDKCEADMEQGSDFKDSALTSLVGGHHTQT